jgi:adenine-specific DNA-methyltransferase
VLRLAGWYPSRYRERWRFVAQCRLRKLPELGRAVPLPYLLWDKTLYLQQEIIWNYGAGVVHKSSRNEKSLWYVKNPDDYRFNLDDIRIPDVAYPNQKRKGSCAAIASVKTCPMFGRLRRSLPGRAARPKNALRTRRSSRSTCASGSSKASRHPAASLSIPSLGSGSTIEAAAMGTLFSRFRDQEGLLRRSVRADTRCAGTRRTALLEQSFITVPRSRSKWLVFRRSRSDPTNSAIV